MIPELKPARTYSPAQVAVATALGGPLAGSLLLAVNEHRLGRKGRARVAAASGFLGTAVLVVVGAFLPGVAAQGLAVGSIVAMHRLAAQLRAARPDAAGEETASWRAAALIGAACLALIVGVAVLVSVAVGLTPRP